MVWDAAADAGVPDRKLKPVAGVIDTPPMRPALRQFVDWVASYTLSPPGEVMAMALRVVAPASRPAGDRLAARRSAAGRADHRGAAQGAGRAGRTGAACHGGTGARGGGRRRCRARHGGCGAAGARRAAGRAAVRDPGSGASGPGPGADQEAAAASLRQAVAAREFSRDAAGRRDRVRQDRGVPGGGGRMPAPGPPGAGAAAGDRAVLAMAGALRAPLRRGAGGVALRSDLAGAPDRPGARWPRARHRWWSARGRRCSCRSPISAWW